MEENVVFQNDTVLFTHDSIEGHMMIDMLTARNLELVTNLSHISSKNSLFGIMNHTNTSMGSKTIIDLLN